MTVTSRILALVAAVLIGGVFVGQPRAQQASDKVLTLQAEANRRFEDLHSAIRRLQAAKAESSPEDAATLQASDRFIQEKRLAEGMSEVESMLRNQQFDEALERMDGVQHDLAKLLDLLLQRARDVDALEKEIERLERYKERLDEIVDQQRGEKDDAAQAEALQKHLEAIAKAKQEMESILAEQEGLQKKADEAGLQAEPKDAEAMSDRQGELGQRTDDMVPKLRQLEKKADELGAKPENSEGKPEDGSKPEGEPKAGEPKDGGGKCAGSCQGASAAMSQSQQKLQKNTPERALEDMNQARAKLQQAIAELEKMQEEAQRKLQELPFDQQSKKQEVTRIDTDRLAQDMETDDRDAAEENAPQQTPGKRNIQQAVPKQKAAAGQLKDYKPGDAKQDQQDALENLEEAQKALEDALTQLRQELQDEVLRALEERFGAMLEKQKELSARTIAAHRLADEALAAKRDLPADLGKRAGEIAVGEHQLAAEAGDALKLLEEDGSTAAFPDVVEMLRDDLLGVADRLERGRVGKTTQDAQAEIEQTLKDLIDALRRQIEVNAGGGQCMCNGQPALVPRSAELKLVMIKQKRVNKRTLGYDSTVPEPLRVTEEAKDAATELSQQQGRVEEILRKIATKLEKDAQAENR